MATIDIGLEIYIYRKPFKEIYMFYIDKSVAAPAKPGVGRPARYPFASMMPGDSFLVGQVDAQRARLAASAWKRRFPGFDYTTRAEDGGLRVWRTA
mgnify:FL=1